jgi:hypothetical protein
MYLAAEYVVAENVSIVVADVPAVARAEPTRASAKAMLVAAAAPSVGVVKVGLSVNATVPVPASSVNAAARFAEVGVSRNVATPVPSDVIPVPPLATGSVPVTPVVKETFVIVLLEPLIVLLVRV